MNFDLRDKEIVKLRASGFTLQKIGRIYDISSERVRKIAYRQDQLSVVPNNMKKIPLRIRNAFARHGVMTYEGIVKAIDSLSDSELLKMEGFGEGSLTYMRYRKWRS